ncbi:hypothetical protein ACU635_33825 [[Actinomadura] parvosata]|uniref:hypothetical protein n=1 Tax=[Actinomadura] parvosata TaxID=1955412 RepID=UPI00406BFD5D
MTGEARLAWNADAYLAKSPGGLAILTPRRMLEIPSDSASVIVDRLKPYLGGDHSLADLTDGLDPLRRGRLETLIKTLIACGAVTEIWDEDRPRDSRRTLVLGRGRLLAAVERAAELGGASSARTIAEADDVIFACDEPDPRELARLEESCEQAGAILHGMIIADGAIWLGRGMASILSRLKGMASGDPMASGRADAVAIRVAAAQAVHGVISGRACARNSVTRIDMRSLASTTHRLQAHPFIASAKAETAGEFEERLTALEGATPLTSEEFSLRITELMDDRIGVFGRPDEGDLTQIPLNVCAIGVSSPADTGSVTQVYGYGADFEAARFLAAKLALRRYSVMMLDMRRLFPAPGDGAEALWGMRLDDRAIVAVKASDVFPAVLGDMPLTRAETCVGAGDSWESAVCQALLGACAAVLDTDESRTWSTALPMWSLDLDAAGRRYRSMITALGLPLELFTVHGSVACPTVIGLLGGSVVGVAVELSVAAAAERAMAQALLHYQASANAEPYLPEGVDVRLPAKREGDAESGVTTSLEMEDLVRILVDRGACPIIVPLDHDPQVAAAMPYLVRVVAGGLSR